MAGVKRFTDEEQRAKARAYSAAYHQANREDCLEKMRERNRRYYLKNRQKLIAKAVEYQRDNAGSRNAYKANWNRRKKHSFPQFAAQCIMRKLVSRTCERIKSSRKEIGRTVSVLGYSTEQFRLHIESQFHAGMSWDNHGEWHVDHIRPLASFDLTNHDQRIAANALSNLQPLWAADNMRKGAKYVADLASNSD